VERLGAREYRQLPLDSGALAGRSANSPALSVISNSVPGRIRSGHEAAWEYDAPKFVEFESHDVSMGILQWQWQWNCKTWELVLWQ